MKEVVSRKLTQYAFCFIDISLVKLIAIIKKNTLNTAEGRLKVDLMMQTKTVCYPKKLKYFRSNNVCFMEISRFNIP